MSPVIWARVLLLAHTLLGAAGMWQLTRRLPWTDLAPLAERRSTDGLLNRPVMVMLATALAWCTLVAGLAALIVLRRTGGRSAPPDVTKHYDGLMGKVRVADMDATREKLVSDLKVLIDDAEELLKATANQAGETVATVRQRIEQSLEEGKRSLAEAEDRMLDNGKEAARTADAYVRENPWNAVGVAAGIGLVLGLIIRRN